MSNSQTPGSILSALPGWEDATFEELNGGLTNRTYLVESRQRKAVLKIDEVPRSGPFNERSKEAHIQTVAAQQGLAAGVLAVPMGLILSVVMIYVVNKRSFGWTLNMQVGPDVVVQAVGLAFVAALLAGLYPAWRMARVSPALALRGE